MIVFQSLFQPGILVHIRVLSMIKIDQCTIISIRYEYLKQRNWGLFVCVMRYSLGPVDWG